MSFTYFDYLINNLMMPVFAIAFILVPLFTLITSTLKHYAKTKTFDTTHPQFLRRSEILHRRRSILRCPIHYQRHTVPVHGQG